MSQTGAYTSGVAPTALCDGAQNPARRGRGVLLVALRLARVLRAAHPVSKKSKARGCPDLGHLPHRHQLSTGGKRDGVTCELPNGGVEMGFQMMGLRFRQAYQTEHRKESYNLAKLPPSLSEGAQLEKNRRARRTAASS